MNQAFIHKGTVTLQKIPEPTIQEGFVKIEVAYSCVSTGTEMISIKRSRNSIIKRVIDDPRKMLEIVDVVKNRGLRSAKTKIYSATAGLNSIGYSVAGRIIELGKGVDDFKVGDLVSAGGSGFAVHAEVVVVPKNLVVKLPVGLDLKYASTGTIGAIALHGVRRADLRIGEYGVIYGVGLLGLLALQILKASGVRTACIDINNKRLELGKELGADLVVNPLEEDPVLSIKNWTSGFGTDAVIFMASTDKDEPLSQSFRMCRRKGKVVLVGVSGMNINRSDIYKEEIDFLISSSYGPGRYDNNYELNGNDYPYAYVRWTEKRNMSEYLNLINGKKLNLDKLSPKIYAIEDIAQAYNLIENYPDDHILTILDYKDLDEKFKQNSYGIKSRIIFSEKKICIGLIGAGNFALNTLLPIIIENKDKFYLKTIVDSAGDKAVNASKLFHAEKASSNPDDILNDPDINLVVICTRHNSHTEFVIKGLEQNKHVYVEKPLATTLNELDLIEKFYKENNIITLPILIVGFNRRFSVFAKEIKYALEKRSSPVLLRYRMNAGYVPYDSWIHQDGGRIVGEACHIIDLIQYLTEAEVVDYAVSSINPNMGKFKSSDNRSIMLALTDGSVASIDYFSCGSNKLSKEYLEVYFDNKSIIMDDYKRLIGYDIKMRALQSSIQEKGHKEEWLNIYESIKKGVWPIALENMLLTTKVSILASM